MSDEARILAGYSDEMLKGAKRDLSAVIASGRAGRWERERLKVIEKEIIRREGFES